MNIIDGYPSMNINGYPSMNIQFFEIQFYEKPWETMKNTKPYNKWFDTTAATAVVLKNNYQRERRRVEML